MAACVSACSVVLGGVNGDVAWRHIAIFRASIAPFRDEGWGDFYRALVGFLVRGWEMGGGCTPA